MPGRFNRFTLLGLGAILLWSTTIAISRDLSEQIGPLTTGCCIHLLAGVLACTLAGLRPGGLGTMLHLPRRYLLGCGAFFLVYMFCLYMAVGSAASRAAVLTVGLLNYLWPAVSLILMVIIFQKKWRLTLPLGILLALAGIVLAVTNGDFSTLREAFSIRNNPWSLGLGFAAALSWGAYSNFSRKWTGENTASAVPLFLLFSGLTLGLLRLFVPEPGGWSVRVVLELIYMAIFPAMLAYSFWETAIRKGDHTLVLTLSYFSPLLSTLISVLILGVPVGLPLLLAAVLTAGGAIVCKVSVIE